MAPTSQPATSAHELYGLRHLITGPGIAASAHVQDLQALSQVCRFLHAALRQEAPASFWQVSQLQACSLP